MKCYYCPTKEACASAEYLAHSNIHSPIHSWILDKVCPPPQRITLHLCRECFSATFKPGERRVRG